jgi:hypothetical protein
LKGRFNPDTGDTFDFKRPTDYLAVETADGDVSGSTASDIITGRASGTVQNYITSFVDFDEADQAIKMGNLDELLAPMSTRVVTRLETNFAKFMVKNVGLLTGTPGTAIDAWSDIAAATAMLKATGVPQDAPWIAAVNSFAQVELADVQRSLGSGGVSGELISEAHQRAIISENFGGMKVMTADTLASHSTFTDADRAGTLTAAPDVTYNTAKNTMTQVLAVTAFGANTVVAAGEVIQITGRNRLNLATRELMLDGTGSAILFTGGGAGAYNTVDSSPTTGDVVTLLGAASKTIQPGLFWHKNAFSIGSVPMKRLYSTDTFAETKDGLQLRVSQGAGFLENTNKVRIDLRPAFAALNPFFAGQLHGS